MVRWKAVSGKLLPPCPNPTLSSGDAAYPKAIDELKAKKELSEDVELRQNKYLNNRIDQNHRFVKN